jgi:hypothetical protein
MGQSVLDVRWFGTSALELIFKDIQGKPGNELLYRTDKARLEVITKGPAWNFDADGHLFRLVSEAYRIKLAYLFDTTPPTPPCRLRSRSKLTYQMAPQTMSCARLLRTRKH